MDDLSALHFPTMPTLRDIEEAVRQLPPEALAEFRQWFAGFDAAAWDHQLEADARDGRLNSLAEEALDNSRLGRCTDL